MCSLPKTRYPVVGLPSGTGFTPAEIHDLARPHNKSVPFFLFSTFFQADDLFHKYVEQVESVFKNLPKPLKWQSFLMHDLSLLTDIPLNVQKISVKHGLNKAKI